MSYCIESSLQLLESMPDSETTQHERMRLAMTRQALVSVPVVKHADAPAKIESSKPARKRAPLTAQQQRALLGLSKAVATTVKQLFERGWFDYARRELRAGRNPGRNPGQRILCAGLLKGGISREQLQMAFQEQLSLTEGSAQVKASRTLSAFHAGGLVREERGRFVLSAN